ncbi:MAG: hypothetical protein C3F18_06515 [Nitrosomonadales bacterium]|nr:MAG: hypothetical protein C3F18_06515 [Nitrosomonadales bacterium]
MKRIIWALAALIIVLGLAGTVGLHFAAQSLKGKVEQALGPESEVGEIILGWSAIEIRQIRIHAPQGWPSQDTLRAEKIVIEPDLRGLLSAQVKLRRIRVEGGYLSLLRSREGNLRLLPSLLEKPAGAAEEPASATPISIGSVELNSSEIEFFDASIRKTPHKLHLEQLQAKVENLQIPALDQQTRMQLDSVVKGRHSDGKLALNGWMRLDNRDSDITTQLRGVDLVAFQPYLVKASETSVRKGLLDLDLKSGIRDNRLHAPGTITLSGLELSSSGSSFSTFMGVPRQAVVAAIKNRDGKISIKFTLEGNIKDPHFSLNESLAQRTGAAIAESLGISLEGLASGVGSATHGVGSAIGRLFGN